MHYSKENSYFVPMNLPNSQELFFFPVVYSILTFKSRKSLICYTFKTYPQFYSLPPLCCCCCCIASVVSNSVQLTRWQLTRLPHPWDSPGKNAGVGCHFLLQCMKVKSESEVPQQCPTLSDPMECSLPGSSVHGIFQARVLEWGAIAFFDLSTAFTLFNPLSSNDGSATDTSSSSTSNTVLDPIQCSPHKTE